MGKLLSLFAGFFIRSVVIKSVALFAIYFLIQAMMPFLIALLPTQTNLNELFNLLPDSVWFYLNYFHVTSGVVMVLSALLVRFIIRRIPIIG